VGTVVVAGALAAKPGNGGEAWVRLSWVLGLRRLGLEAWLLEEVDPSVAAAGRPFFEQTVAAAGLGPRVLLLVTGEAEGRSRAAELADEATALVNISGNLRDTELLARFRRRAYVDLDPGFTQIWQAQGHLGDQLSRHDRHFTVGLNLGASDCEIPADGFEWIPLPPPVLLEEWAPPERREFDRFTTVATWRNALGRPEHAGRAYTLKHHQLRRFADLPERSGLPFEIALEVHPDEAEEAERLRRLGWSVVEPGEVAADPRSFRDYVRGSGAELSVAQGIYAETRSGWISDRTAHYLAAGRPAVVQETGLPPAYRPEAGLLTFSDPDEATEAASQVVAEYGRHAAAARAFAEETFDSDRVLRRMLEALG
jgi:Glycosyl transferases group 1